MTTLSRKAYRRGGHFTSSSKKPAKKKTLTSKYKTVRKEDYKISKVKHQWGKSERDARGGARYPSLPNKKPPPHENRSKNKRKKKEAPRIAAKNRLHPPGHNCPAYGQQCLKSGKYNHYTTCCRSGSDKRQAKAKSHEKKKSRKQPGQTTMQAASQIANTSADSTTRPTSSKETDIRKNSGYFSYKNETLKRM